MVRPAPDPEVAATLVRRAAVFELVKELRAAGTELTADGIKAAMRAQPDGSFKPADYLWVDTTLAKRLGSL